MQHPSPQTPLERLEQALGSTFAHRWVIHYAKLGTASARNDARIDEILGCVDLIDLHTHEGAARSFVVRHCSDLTLLTVPQIADYLTTHAKTLHNSEQGRQDALHIARVRKLQEKEFLESLESCNQIPDTVLVDRKDLLEPAHSSNDTPLWSPSVRLSSSQILVRADGAKYRRATLEVDTCIHGRQSVTTVRRCLCRFARRREAMLGDIYRCLHFITAERHDHWMDALRAFQAAGVSMTALEKRWSALVRQVGRLEAHLAWVGAAEQLMARSAA